MWIKPFLAPQTICKNELFGDKTILRKRSLYAKCIQKHFAPPKLLMVALWCRSKTLGHHHHTSPPKVIYYWSYLFWWYWPEDQTSLTGSTGHPIIWLLFAHFTLSTPKGTIWHFHTQGQKLKPWNTKCNAGLRQTWFSNSWNLTNLTDRTWNL